MEPVISWLLSIEKMAGELYAGAAEHFKEDRPLALFLTRLADDEALHALAMGSAAALWGAEREQLPEPVLLDDSIKDQIENRFRASLQKLEDGTLDRQTLLACIADTEFSEWNDFFLYVIKTLQERSREFQYVAARLQAHQKMIENFLEQQPASQELLSKVKQLPVVWEGRILLVDDSEPILELLEAVLRDVARIDKALDTSEGLGKVKENCYDLIISDVKTPDESGLEFYQKAVLLDERLKERFLFYTGFASAETVGFFKQHNLPYLLKPARIADVREKVQSLLQRQQDLPRESANL